MNFHDERDNLPPPLARSLGHDELQAIRPLPLRTEMESAGPGAHAERLRRHAGLAGSWGLSRCRRSSPSSIRPSAVQSDAFFVHEAIA